MDCNFQNNCYTAQSAPPLREAPPPAPRSPSTPSPLPSAVVPPHAETSFPPHSLSPKSHPQQCCMGAWVRFRERGSDWACNAWYYSPKRGGGLACCGFAKKADENHEIQSLLNIKQLLNNVFFFQVYYWYEIFMDFVDDH